MAKGKIKLEHSRERGLSAVCKMWLHRTLNVLCVLIITPILYGLEFVYPVRFGRIYDSRIGHMALNTGLFLRRLQLGLLPQDRHYIFFVLSGYFYEPANQTLLNLFKRKLNLVSHPLLVRIYNFFSWGLEQTRFFQSMHSECNEFREFSQPVTLLEFTEEEEEMGRAALRAMGIGPNDWFVCFHARDSAYIKAAFGIDKDTGDYRDCSYIGYIKAAQYITEQGGFAVRMGSVVEKPLPETGNSRIIDYATRYRTDFLDIYLSAKCTFYFGCASGLWCVPAIFGKPVACGNWAPIDDAPWAPYLNFVMHKKVLDQTTGRILRYREIFDRGLEAGIKGAAQPGHYERHQIKLIENTEEEILDFIREVDGVVRLNQKPDPLALEESKKFYPAGAHMHGTHTLLSANYIRKNSELFEVI